jgi:hypothetical protein
MTTKEGTDNKALFILMYMYFTRISSPRDSSALLERPV